MSAINLSALPPAVIRRVQTKRRRTPFVYAKRYGYAIARGYAVSANYAEPGSDAFAARQDELLDMGYMLVVGRA